MGAPHAPRSPRAEDVIAFVDGCRGAFCTGCEDELVPHEAVVSLFLGHGHRPRCVNCLAAALDDAPGALIERAARAIARLECYRAGWRHADRAVAASGPWPDGRIPARLRLDDEDEDDAPGDGAEPRAERSFDAGELFDAGDTACGELVLALRTRLNALPDGARLHLVATDLGAGEDIPAWCRVTGHRLERADPPHFLIARKPRPPGEST